jgi:hypothetical protein
MLLLLLLLLLQGCWSWSVYIPMAALGFSPAQFIAHKSLNLLFQFWVPTHSDAHLLTPLMLTHPDAHSPWRTL